MASVHPHVFLSLFRRGGRGRERWAPPLLLAVVVKPVGDTKVGDLRISNLFQIGEYLLSFFLLRGVGSVMKIVCGMDHGHLPIRAKRRDGLPLRNAFPA